jgi:peptidoglycan-associated lipoprotein
MMRSAAVCLVALLAVPAGCAKQPSVTQTSAPSPTGVAPAPSKVAGSRAPTSGAAPRAAAKKPLRGTTMIQAGAARPQPLEYVDIAELEDIHFDFDRYDLRDSDRLILDRHATWLREHAKTLLLVEGHCDPRGTTAYNVSLGERRAKATANYLTSRGIASDRITIVSYGEERPVCREEDEECWSRNRRAHFRVKLQ